MENTVHCSNGDTAGVETTTVEWEATVGVKAPCTAGREATAGVESAAHCGGGRTARVLRGGRDTAGVKTSTVHCGGGSTDRKSVV